ncbi:MAG: hypothetical protein ACUVWN_10270 [bacterium]
MKKIYFICFAIPILLLCLSGCQKQEKPRFIMCFVDYSESAINNRYYYQEQLKEISQILKSGDRLLVFKITDKTQTDAIPILDSGEYPRSSLDENSLIYEKKCEEFKTKLVSKIQSACEDIANGDTSKYTDIFGAFITAGDLASSWKNYNIDLVILSDGLLDSLILKRRYNFEKDKIDDKYRSDLISTLEQNNLVPDLSGVSVYFVGVRSAQDDKSDERFMEVRRFWQIYIEHTGAKLKGYGQAGFLIH